MTNSPTKGRGKTIQFILDHVGYRGRGCLVWPFCTSDTGYGRLSYLGTVGYAHRLMCELVHGPSPAGHEASHSCGNGGGGCVNPRHLSWKTPSQNQLDRRRHGTHVTNKYGPRGKLTVADKKAIRALRGKRTQRAIAVQFGVHFETISRVLRTNPNLGVNCR